GGKVTRSAEFAPVLSTGVPTTTNTLPPPAGETASISVSDLTLKLLALVAPNLTPLTPLKPVPVIFTLVPPSSEPSLGLIAVTVGKGPKAKPCSSPAAMPLTFSRSLAQGATSPDAHTATGASLFSVLPSPSSFHVPSPQSITLPLASRA